ncbi:MAG: mucoidy inhibitor MuiA family protein [Bacteroidales bacterium]|nr:mucoidy inhibitor MuiA family protein [Bacteroidales bacterium]
MEILKSIISNVTVYSDRAQITRIAKISLPEGENTVVFSDLPKKIDQNSIQVKGGGGNAVLNDIKFKEVFHHEIQNEAVAELFKKMIDIQKEIELIDENINLEVKELDFVEKIIAKSTHVAEKETINEELNPEKWIKMVDFYRQKNENISKKIREYKYQKVELSEKIKVLQKEISSLGNDKNKTTNQVEIVVTNNTKEELVFSLTYIVYGAYWSPLYDLRVSSENQKVSIEYKAQVTQNTGEIWENVKLAISTAQVNVSGTMPELSPWRVGFYIPLPAPSAEVTPKMFSKGAKMKMDNRKEGGIVEKEEEVMLRDIIDEAPMKKPKAEVKTGATSVLFEIPNKVTILNDNQPHKVNIIIEELSADFTYAIVPKLSQYAYLKAKIKNTTEYPFLPGESNIFLDGSFVANSSLKLIAPTEEFEASLGVDEGVKVEHKLVKRYEKNTGLISKKSNIVFEYQTVITNNKKHKHKFVNYNQIPISQHSDIKVELITPEYKEDTDFLKIDNEKKITWKFELEPTAKKTIDFIFSIESPRDSNLDGV